MSPSPRSLASTLVIAAFLVTVGCSDAPRSPSSSDRPTAPLSSSSRWLVDADGRVVILHGVNDVVKSPPFYPAAVGFGEDDVRFLAAEGFNVLRLGIEPRGLIPEPGLVDDAYVEHLAETVELCARYGIFVLLDFHQDGFAPKYNGNGFPDWMGIDDGLPNPPDAHFPLYYVLNPAMQRAFEHFWADDAIPDGRRLQDLLFQGIERVMTRFADEPMVIGTELLNEPWPGAVYQPCVTPPDGCVDLEQERLMPFYRRALSSARAIAPRQLLFIEPFVLFNFGQAPTSLPGTDPGLGLAFHSYAIDVDGEKAVARYGREAAERDGAPALVTEFGATTDPGLARRIVGQLDGELLPWIYWAYNEQIVTAQQRPLTEEAIARPAVLAELVRPYPQAVAGVPTSYAFDPTSRVFDLAYTTERAGGGSFAPGVETLVAVPRRAYPSGYSVAVTGAVVTSEPCAPTLRLRSDGAVRSVRVQITEATGDGC